MPNYRRAFVPGGFFFFTVVVHRRRGIWQPRFWEHTLEGEDDFEHHFDYVHWNPVKHKHVTCPHEWPHSSFHRYVSLGVYNRQGGCFTAQMKKPPLDFSDIEDQTGEPT